MFFTYCYSDSDFDNIFCLVMCQACVSTLAYLPLVDEMKHNTYSNLLNDFRHNFVNYTL